MKSLQTVKEYNEAQKSASSMFQNEDGSQRKRGFVVVTEGGQAHYFKTQAEAAEFFAAPVEAEVTVGMNEVDKMNN